jgi:transcriptional repressor NrdR
MVAVNCPSCSGPSHVLESRPAEDGDAVRRRRECEHCGERFTTYERRAPEPVFVRKRSGERQPFERAKLRAALARAAHKRPVSSERIDAIVRRVEHEAGSSGELGAARIGELCMAELRELDVGAYLQYAGTLAEPAAAISGGSGIHALGGSVRAARKDAELPAKAASRRGTDE